MRHFFRALSVLLLAKCVFNFCTSSFLIGILCLLTTMIITYGAADARTIGLAAVTFFANMKVIAALIAGKSEYIHFIKTSLFL